MENYSNFYPNSVYQYPAYIPQNSYTGRLGQIQQGAFLPQINSAQTLPVLGKIVDGIEAVKAADIPMDGKTYFFPKADGKEIYGKRWMDDGTTHISKFSTDDAEELKQDKDEIASFSEEITGKLLSRFDDVEEKIEKLEKSLKNIRVPSSGSRKDEDA